jgi:hypothetical protein
MSCVDRGLYWCRLRFLISNEYLKLLNLSSQRPLIVKQNKRLELQEICALCVGCCHLVAPGAMKHNGGSTLITKCCVIFPLDRLTLKLSAKPALCVKISS